MVITQYNTGHMLYLTSKFGRQNWLWCFSDGYLRMSPSTMKTWKVCASEPTFCKIHGISKNICDCMFWSTWEVQLEPQQKKINYISCIDLSWNNSLGSTLGSYVFLLSYVQGIVAGSCFRVFLKLCPRLCHFYIRSISPFWTGWGMAVMFCHILGIVW